MLLAPLRPGQLEGRLWRNRSNTTAHHYYSTRLHQPHWAILYCSTLFLPSHRPKRPLLVHTRFFLHLLRLCSEAKKSLYFIMGNRRRLTSISRNFSKCYVVNGRRTLFFFKNRQTLFWPSTNTFRELCFISVDEHFFLLHKISTNTFFTTMGLRIFFNISTHIDEHLMYYITLVIFSTFQHKSTNTFFYKDRWTLFGHAEIFLSAM